jgi:hypothetical protein
MYCSANCPNRHPPLLSASAAAADLQKRLADKSSDNPFNIAVESWVRQRAYALWAVQELGEWSHWRAAPAAAAGLVSPGCNCHIAHWHSQPEN